MAESREFEAFIAECGEAGMPAVKAFEAALDDLVEVLEMAPSGAELRAQFFDFLKQGVDYARAMETMKEGDLDD